MLISLLITRNVCILSLREMLSNEKTVSTMVYLGQGVGCQKKTYFNAFSLLEFLSCPNV